jgi:asparagine synthase (glutamine-hydrolysing)
MCGVYGRFGDSVNSCPNQDDLNSLRALSHRGPDGSGFSAGKNYILGHARLSILDQSVFSSQPLPTPSGRYLLSFNGEIYNYGALHKKYFKQAKAAKSDTQVLTQLIDLIGLSVMTELRGMFGILLVDTLENKVHIIRDQFGQKQLYYHLEKGSFRVASEIKALLPKREFGLNLQAVYEYMARGIYDDGKNTFVDGIFSVEPGEIVSVDLDSLSVRSEKFWDIDKIEVGTPKDSNYCVEELGSLLSGVVHGALHGDFSHAISLSGGLDGAALLALSKKTDILSKIDRAYTVSFGDFSEVPEASIIARYFGLPHEVIEYTPEDFYTQLSESIASQEGPVGGLMNCGLQALAKRVSRAGYKTLIGGMGVDEIFGGYTSLNPKYFLARPNGSVLIDGSKGALGNSVFSADGLARVKVIGEHQSECATPRDMQLDILKTSKLPRNLRMLDRLSMKSSLEMRSPFLDVDILDFALKIPVNAYYEGDLGKIPVRRLISNDVPEFLMQTPKTSVQTPQRQWLMSKKFTLLFEKILSDREFFEKYGLNLERFKDMHIEAKLDQSAKFPLWQLLNVWLLDDWIRQS